jgi:c-di-GMP-binding flagellar brake protein YcgR
MELPGFNENRREHHRKILRTHARLLLPSKEVVTVRTFDISAGGMGVAAGISPPTGMRLGVQLYLPTTDGGRELLMTEATVTHSVLSQTEQGFKIGLRFVLADASSAVLARYLKL